MYHSSRNRSREPAPIRALEVVLIVLVIAAVVGLIVTMFVWDAIPGGPVPWTVSS